MSGTVISPPAVIAHSRSSAGSSAQSRPPGGDDGLLLGEYDCRPLFGLYHVHKIWSWPSMITSSFGYAWAARRYCSLWMGVIVHGVEGFFIVLVLAVILGWYP